MPLNISPSHSRSLKVIRNDTPSVGREYDLVSYPAAAAAPINIPLKLSLYVVAFPRYSALNNGMTLESGEGGRGSSWSLKMVSLDRSYTTYTIWSAVVCIV